MAFLVDDRENVEEFPDEDCTAELAVKFEPDDDLDVAEDTTDIDSFHDILAEKISVFLERRKRYGNHLNNADRFPREHSCGLYLKCVRAIRMIESGEAVDGDTLLDLGNYADLILSHRKSAGAE